MNYQYIGEWPVSIALIDKNGEPVTIVKDMELSIDKIRGARVSLDANDSPNIYLVVEQ